MKDIQEARGDIESSIILAMSARAACRTQKDAKRRKMKNGLGHVEESPMDAYVSGERFPKSFYAFDAANSDQRLYSLDYNDLVVNPYHAIRGGLEIGMIMDDGGFKWSGFFPMKKPRGLTAITNKRFEWFGSHFRHLKPSGGEVYVKRPMAVAHDGTVCLLGLMGGWKGYNAKQDQNEMSEQLYMSVSVFEDAVRDSSYLATVHEYVEMKFPVGEAAYKSFFAMRDGYRDTPTGRRNPIVHWCAEHLRDRGEKGVSVVRSHRRGAQEFICGPMRLTIEENEGYGAWTA